jgi:hypothetical protein
MSLLNFILYILGYAETKFIDLISIIFFGYITENTFGMTIAQTIQLGHSALMGILFAYLVPKINSNYLTFKGATYGCTVWFIIFAIGSLYKLPLYAKSSEVTVFTYLFTSATWGIAVAFVLAWFEQRYESPQESRHTRSIITAPAYKRYSDENVERLEERLEQDEKLIMQVVREQRSKRSFLTRLKFW